MQRAGTAFNSRPYKYLLNVTNGEKFGDWTWPEMCPENFYAVGFSLRVKAQTTARTGARRVLTHKIRLQLLANGFVVFVCVCVEGGCWLHPGSLKL